MCQLKLIPKIFSFDEADVPAELRAQRVLNKARIPTLTQYLLENPSDYVFSSITASIDGPVEFEPLDKKDSSRNKVGQLRIPMSSRIIINDGQHRRAAIEHALHEKPELGFDSLSVVFFIDEGLRRSQQMFADLNQHAVRPTKSLGILYDHRDPFSRFIIRLIDEVDIFRNRVELEKISISNRSLKFFTLSTIYQANRALLAKNKAHEKVSSEEEVLAIEYWNNVTEHVPQWKLLMKNKVSPDELRRDYIHAHGIALHALGIAGHNLIQEFPEGWKKILKRIDSLDWSRANTAVWEGRATVGGTVSKSRTNLVLTSNLLKKTLALQLTKEEQKIEDLRKPRGRRKH